MARKCSCVVAQKNLRDAEVIPTACPTLIVAWDDDIGCGSRSALLQVISKHTVRVLFLVRGSVTARGPNRSRIQVEQCGDPARRPSRSRQVLGSIMACSVGERELQAVAATTSLSSSAD